MANVETELEDYLQELARVARGLRELVEAGGLVPALEIARTMEELVSSGRADLLRRRHRAALAIAQQAAEVRRLIVDAVETTASEANNGRPRRTSAGLYDLAFVEQRKLFAMLELHARLLTVPEEVLHA